MSPKMIEPKKQEVFCTKDKGYRGFWYGCTKLDNEYAYKYSGGLGTYCAKHIPFAVYSKKAQKTFFCYGGTNNPDNRGEKHLLHMVSYYDHKKHIVPRPTILLDKWCADGHDNPVISIDGQGYIWIFSSSHGQGTTPSYIHKSCKPFSIDEFETVSETLYSYPQVKYIKKKGFIFFHTCYDRGRRFIRFTKSKDGFNWDKKKMLSRIEAGHYQVSSGNSQKIGTFLNYHPENRAIHGLDLRTNLYYLESKDFGESWQNIEGESLELPLLNVDNPALIYDFAREDLKIYLKDMVYDYQNNPVLLFLSSNGFEPGPQKGPRNWHTVRWNGSQWEFSKICSSDSNYDMGSLYIEEKDKWKVIAPTKSGPQLFNPGGEVEIWVSNNQGETWDRKTQLTRNSRKNQTYIRRPVNAHPQFYAFWADGHGRKPSASCLYFTNQTGTDVWQLPFEMTEKYQQPKKMG
ncbi:MAG: BNR-4 repeat-containing protein [Bacillota bacterium]